MKKEKLLLLGYGLFLGSMQIYGGTLDTILANLKGINTLEDDGQYHSGYLYNSKIIYKIVGGNNNHQLDPNEKIYIKVITPSGDVLETPPDGIARGEVLNWVKEHSSKVAKIIVGGGGISSVSQGAGYSNNIAIKMGEIGLEEAISYQQDGPFSEKIFNKLKGIGEKTDYTSPASYKWNFKYGAESGRFHTWGDDGHTQLIEVRGSRKLSISQLKVGGLIAFKYTKVDDQWGTNSKTLTFMPYLKYRFTPYKNGFIDIMPYLGGSVIFSRASNFPEVDYYEYGWGMNIIPTYTFNPQFQSQLLVGYYWDKKYVPSSSLPDNYKFIATSTNNLKPDQVFTLGIGFNYLPAPHWKLSGNVIRLQHILAKEVEPGRDRAIYYKLKTDYTQDNWSVGAGLRVVTQLEEYRETDAMVNFKYIW